MHPVVRSQAATFVFGFILSIPVPAFAQAAPAAEQRARAVDLTQALVALNERARGAGRGQQEGVTGEMLAAAAERRQLLSAMIASDPGQVLRLALPADVRAGLPPAVRDLVEEHVEIDGTLEVFSEDYTWGSRVGWLLRSGGRTLSLHFAAEPPGFLTGNRVRARGVRVDSALALESGATSVQVVTAAALPNTFGEQRTLVLLVNFQDYPVQPYSVGYAHGVVFNTTSDYQREASFQQTWLTGDTFGWFTIPMNSTVCDRWAMAGLADQVATAAGVNVSAYTRLLYAFPQNACTWWGMSSIGGNPSRSWVNGTFILRVVGHELGHGYGLFHARSLDCGSSPIDPPCTVDEYGDTVDLMGAVSGHFSAFMKERLGWLAHGSSPPITTVETDGTYWLEPFAAPPGGGAKALKILKSTDPATGHRTFYYVEFRRALGFDSFLAGNSNVLNGVVIHTGSESSGNTSYLLDMTPQTASWNDPALGVGLSFTDPGAGVTIRTVSAGSTGASVAVSFATTPCTPGNPTVTISPSLAQGVMPGTTVDYTVRVENTDSAACAAASFDLAATVPDGWFASFASPALTIGTGGSASTTMQVTSPATEVDGTYEVTASATHGADAGRSGAASATYVVSSVSSLSVAVSTDRASYKRKQTIYMTATVAAGGAPAAGASVTFTITKANGGVVTRTATTDAGGRAAATYTVGGKDPFGTYRLDATASLNGVSGSATTTFAVIK